MDFTGITGATTIRDDGSELLVVPCKAGHLVAQFTGDPGIYDGIGIDLVRPDGAVIQCVTVETVDTGELHALCWDGNEEDPVSEVKIDPDGEMAY